MQAGRLKRRLTIEEPSASKDDFGQPLQTWTSVLETWGDIRAITGKEIFALGSGFTSQVTHKIVLRFPSVALVAGMRVCYLARIFLVQFVSDPNEDRRELDLICLELSK